MIHLFYENGQIGSVMVDWLSLSLDIIHRERPDLIRLAPSVVAAVCGVIGVSYTTHFVTLPIKEVKSAPGYSASFSIPDAGMRIDYRENGKVLVSWSGQGCIWLREHKLMERMMSMGIDHASRVDVALDVPDSRLPSEVIDIENLSRDRTTVLWRSPTGETLYLGSMSSKRFARLYRYTQTDHARKHLLRLEVVYRNYVAQATCKAICSGKLLSLVHTECQRLDLLELIAGAKMDEISDSKLTVYIKSRNPNTMKWLESAVVPALQRLVDDGDIADAKAYMASIIDKMALNVKADSE